MKLLNLILLFLSTVLVISCKSTFYSVNIKETEKAKPGVIYSLPKTKLNVNIEITETHKQKGPFAKYTYLYFSSKNAVLKDDVEYIISDINIQTIPVLDPKNIYNVNSEKKNVASLINLTPEGFIAGINLNDYRAEKIQIEQKTISDLIQKKQKLDYADYSLKSIRETQFDTIYKEVLQDSVLVRIPIIKKKKVFKSIEKQAKEIADILFLLRDDRNALLIGENDGNNFPDGEALSLMLSELNELEKQYMSLFTGREVKVTKNYNFEIIPQKDLIDSLIYLSDFSDKKGIANTHNSGKTIYLKFTENTDIHNISEFTKANLVLSNDESGYEGIIYRIPAKISSQIIFDNKEIYKKDLRVSQFGTLNLIPSEIINNNVSIEFYTKTGSLKRISKLKPE